MIYYPLKIKREMIKSWSVFEGKRKETKSIPMTSFSNGLLAGDKTDKSGCSSLKRKRLQFILGKETSLYLQRFEMHK